LVRALACLLVLLLAAAPALAQTRYVHAGRLVDTVAGEVLEDRLIRIEDGRIAAVEPWASPPAGAEVVDWSAYTVLPGLIDAHTHLADWGQSSNVAEPLLHSAQEIALVGAHHARLTLEAGLRRRGAARCDRERLGAGPAYVGGGRLPYRAGRRRRGNRLRAGRERAT
jgi:imidazolonepropionase-like amidohydrolase